MVKYLNTKGGRCNVAVQSCLVNSNISNGVGFVARVGQEQEITPIEGWLHRSTIENQHTQDVAKSAFHTSRTGATQANATHLRTTTMGLSVLQMRPRPFHIISPDAITFAKFIACSRACSRRRKSGLQERSLVTQILVNSVPGEVPCVEERLTRRRTFDDEGGVEVQRGNVGHNHLCRPFPEVSSRDESLRQN